MSATMKGVVRCGDANIYYETYGRGEPLVMLHGNSEDHHYFVNQVGYFSRRFRVILIDTRGHGKSSLGSRPLDFKLLSDDVATVLQELSIYNAHILGFSDGGNIALHLALRHPECVASLILNGANLSPEGMKLDVLFPIIIGYQCCRFWGKSFDFMRKQGEILSLMAENPKLDSKRLERIKIPALVIVGQYDMIKEKHSILITKSLPHAQIAIIPGATHFVALEMPKQFNHRVLEFLHGINSYISI